MGIELTVRLRNVMRPRAERMICVKKMLAIFLAMSLMLGVGTAWAEGSQAPDEERDTLVVGSTTAMSGNFFSEMFGNNTADLDVRMLLHDYNLMEWQSGLGSYGVNRSAVSGLIAMDDEAGNRTYTVSIYSDMKYSDGTPITAADYAFSMLLSMAPEMRQIGAQTVYSDYIIGVDEYVAGETNVLTGMRILNDTTLAIHVKASYQPFFYELALLDYVPYPIHVIAPGCEVVDNGEGVLIKNIDETIEEPIFTAELLRETILDPETGYLTHPSVVSGAYVLDSYDEQTHTATFSMNPYYKGDFVGRLPSIPKLVYKNVSPDHMVEALASGEVDLLNKCSAADVISQGARLVSEESFSMLNYPRSGYSFVSFSCERPVVGSDVVRKAIAHCMDKDALVKSYVANYGMAVDGYYGIGQWLYALGTGRQAPPVHELPEDASPEERALYEETLDAWSKINMDGVQVYEFNVEEAVRLLERDGWVLNESGAAYNPEEDAFRCKEVDGELLALDLKMIYPEGNAIGEAFEEYFIEHLAEAGIRVTMEAKPMTELLDIYYRNVDREVDLIYLATNFATVFDPSYTYSPEDAYQGTSNRSGIADAELYKRAVDMRMTQPGDVLSYVRKWVSFQERWAEVLPTIPVYSNVYFDFYTDWLHDYTLTSGMTWSEAIIGAYLAEPQVEAEEDDLIIAE